MRKMIDKYAWLFFLVAAIVELILFLMGIEDNYFFILIFIISLITYLFKGKSISS
ncbi:hypothetical protein CM15mP37_13190 [bacterium]|jgi:hypothetical protein|nr:MAG: hypothetical protein CM15mP37_13190 [bacterium]